MARIIQIHAAWRSCGSLDLGLHSELHLRLESPLGCLSFTHDPDELLRCVGAIVSGGHFAIIPHGSTLNGAPTSHADEQAAWNAIVAGDHRIFKMRNDEPVIWYQLVFDAREVIVNGVVNWMLVTEGKYGSGLLTPAEMLLSAASIILRPRTAPGILATLPRPCPPSA